MRIRPVLFWCHLVLAVASGLVILLMSVTGVLLTYERQMVAWADSAYRSTPAGNRLSVADMIARVQAAQPGVTPTAVTIAADPDAPVTVTDGQRTFLIDAYSGQVLGESAPALRRFMNAMKSWHRWFAIEGEGRQRARAITGWSNLAFLFIVVSGIYLWVPRRWNWRQLRTVTLFNGKLRGKARDFNWHNVFGSWSTVPLFIVVLSAVPISFPWANELVYRAAGEVPPSAGAREGGAPARPGNGSARVTTATSLDSLDVMFERASRHEADWRTISLRLPPSSRAPLTFTIDRGNGGQPHLRSTLTVAATGEVVKYERFEDQSAGRRLRSIMRFAHTGEILGVPGQTIAGLASAGAVVLVYTGFALAMRRLRSSVTRPRAAEREQTRSAA